MHGYFNYAWSGLRLDKKMPDLCKGGIQSKLRILAYAELTPNDPDKPGAWTCTQPMDNELGVSGEGPIWYHGESEVRTSCKDFEITFKEKIYNPSANNGAGGFVEGNVIGTVDDDCIVSLTATTKPRALSFLVKSKLTSEQIFPGHPGLPVHQKDGVDELFIDCGP